MYQLCAYVDITYLSRCVSGEYYRDDRSPLPSRREQARTRSELNVTFGYLPHNSEFRFHVVEGSV